MGRKKQFSDTDLNKALGDGLTNIQMFEISFNEVAGFTENIVTAQSIFPVFLNPHLMSEKTFEVSKNSGDILKELERMVPSVAAIAYRCSCLWRRTALYVDTKLAPPPNYMSI